MLIDKSLMVVTKDTNIEKYAFIPLTEKEYKEFDLLNSQFYSMKVSLDDFIKKTGINPSKSIMHGEVKSIDSGSVANFIDFEYIKETEESVGRKSYKCFCGEKHNLDYKKTILHGTPLNSWECLMIKCGFPKYGILLNIL